MIVATATSSHAVLVPQTPNAASITTVLLIASLREQSDRTFTRRHPCNA